MKYQTNLKLESWDKEKFDMHMDGGVTKFHDLKVVKNFGCPDFILFYKEQLGVDKI